MLMLMTFNMSPPHCLNAHTRAICSALSLMLLQMIMLVPMTAENQMIVLMVLWWYG
jgi:hypothetical protein